MHRSSSFNQSHYHKCCEDFHTMFHKSRLWCTSTWTSCMHTFLFDTFDQCVCIHTVPSLLHTHILAEWSSVEALLYCQTDTSHSQWVWYVWICIEWLVTYSCLVMGSLRWHFRASSVGGIFSKLLVLRNCEQRTSWMDVICPDFLLSLATMDVSIRCTNKSQLNTIHESKEDISCPTLPPATLPTYTIINGMELIYSIGKPTGASNFWWISRYRHSKHEIKLFKCLYQGGYRIWQIHVYITLHQTWFQGISCQRTTFTRTGKTLWTCQKIWGAYHFLSNQLIQYTL